MNKNSQEKEKEKNKEANVDKTKLKSYRVPDANSKKYFEKINIYNFIGITKYFTFPEMLQLCAVCPTFNQRIEEKYIKRIPLIKTTLKILKKNIIINFSEDLCFLLRKNSAYISELTKNMVLNFEVEYIPKMGLKKYFFSRISANPDIKKVDLDNCDIGKKSMKNLSYYFENKNCNIKELIISNNKLTGEIMKPLENNPSISLDNLNVNKCNLDVKTFSFLSKINTKKLSLEYNNIDNELISKIENDHITDLDISFNSISDEGLFSICNNLPNLTSLNLESNNICDLSIVYICLYLKEKSKILNLNLKDNKITITGMITLISTLDKINKKINKEENYYSLHNLDFSGNLLDLVPIPKRLGIHFLNVRIEQLALGNHSFNIDDLNILMNFINNIKNITLLDLSKIGFDNYSLNLIFNRVSENASLKNLKLRNCYLGNTEVNKTLENYYTKSGKLKNEIIMNDNKEENDKNKINNENEDNTINKEEETDNMIISEKCIGIESLDLSYNFINYQKLDKIILSNKIKELNIEGNDLYLHENDLYLFFDFLIDNKVLEKLNLNKNYLQAQAKKLLEKINDFNIKNKSNCSLKFLSLEDNQIKDINLELTNLLSNNKNLETLKLGMNLISDEIGNNYFFHSLFKNKNSNLKEIDISNNKISLGFVDKIINYSKENNPLEKNDFELNVTSKEIREAYSNLKDKTIYKELVKLNNIICL